MKKIFLFTLILMLSGTAYAQHCEGFYPMNEGAVIETQSFNKKGKLQGTSRQTILSVEELDEGISIRVKSEQMDEKGKPTFDQELTMRCVEDVFYMDMKDMLDPQTMSAYKDMEISVSGVDLEFPANLQVGQTLPNSNMTMSVSSSGFNVMAMDFAIKNRQVEAYEPITTPAGTFDCYKITYDMEVKTIVKIMTKGAEWVAKNVGVVRSEQYDKKGNMSGYTLLSKFEN